VSLEALVQVAMSRPQSLNHMHFSIVPVSIGKEADKFCFELFIGMNGGSEQLCTA
jgi:hypothetical protein